MRNKSIEKLGNSFAARINNEIFSGWLPNMPVIACKKNFSGHKNAIAFYYNNKCYLLVNNIRKFLKEFYGTKITDMVIFELVAHEIIHHAQNFFESPMGHNNKLFRYYAEKIERQYDLPFKIKATQQLYYGER